MDRKELSYSQSFFTSGNELRVCLVREMELKKIMEMERKRIKLKKKT